MAQPYRWPKIQLLTLTLHTVALLMCLLLLLHESISRPNQKCMHLQAFGAFLGGFLCSTSSSTNHKAARNYQLKTRVMWCVIIIMLLNPASRLNSLTSDMAMMNMLNDRCICDAVLWIYWMLCTRSAPLARKLLICIIFICIIIIIINIIIINNNNYNSLNCGRRQHMNDVPTR